MDNSSFLSEQTLTTIIFARFLNLPLRKEKPMEKIIRMERAMRVILISNAPSFIDRIIY